MTRAASSRRVFFVEEPRHGAAYPRIESRQDASGVSIAIPHLADGPDPSVQLKVLLDFHFSSHKIEQFVAWYYTPMALESTRHLKPIATVYDCMDELTAFAGAPPGMRAAEAMLLSRADLVLTGGRSLYEAKRHLHSNIHAFPSSVDADHFARARRHVIDPADQAGIPRPRIGFFGVLDERLDRRLVAEIARLTPGWHYVMIGPIAKIDPRDLPAAPNIHYLGQKTYEALPDYIGGWDVAMMPFARNEATRYISPTKTPEYLAAGRPVVSTSIADVVRPYGQEGLARIADTPEDFVECIRAALLERTAEWLPRADAFLARNSWDSTWSRISERLRAVILARRSQRVDISA
jgi:glycosyltransferase involved in cell wall biosynthesis